MIIDVKIWLKPIDEWKKERIFPISKSICFFESHLQKLSMCVSCIPDVWESMHGLAWGVPLSAEGPKPLSTPLCISSVKDKKSFLGIEEEVSENPYRYKASCVTQLLTPQSESLRQWSLTWWLSWTGNWFILNNGKDRFLKWEIIESILRLNRISPWPLVERGLQMRSCDGNML